MKKPSRKHVLAVKHAQELLKKAAKRLPDGPTHDDLQSDIKLLSEVATMMHYQIVNPTLPFEIPDEPELVKAQVGVEYYGPTNAR